MRLLVRFPYQVQNIYILFIRAARALLPANRVFSMAISDPEVRRLARQLDEIVSGYSPMKALAERSTGKLPKKNKGRLPEKEGALVDSRFGLVVTHLQVQIISVMYVCMYE